MHMWVCMYTYSITNCSGVVYRGRSRESGRAIIHNLDGQYRGTYVKWSVNCCPGNCPREIQSEARVSVDRESRSLSRAPESTGRGARNIGSSGFNIRLIRVAIDKKKKRTRGFTTSHFLCHFFLSVVIIRFFLLFS